MRLSDPRAIERALADLIERRETKVLLVADRTLLDRMIGDLQAEIYLRHRGKARAADLALC